MDVDNTALVLIGFQNDSFALNGALHSIYEGSEPMVQMLSCVLHVIEALAPTPMLMIHAPILFSPDYRELPPTAVGLLNQIKTVGAHCRSTVGGETIPELRMFGDRIIEIEGKVGFNAFGHTNLAQVLNDHNIRHTVIMGVATSICIDSTGRAAAENGFNVVFPSNCHGGRTQTECRFYNEEIFPLYSTVIDSERLLSDISGWKD